MRGTIVILVLVAWYGLILLDEDRASATYRLSETWEEGFENVEPESPSFVLASALEDSHWELKQCQTEPDMFGAGADGYRIILAHEWRDTERSVGIPDIRHTFIQLCLIPEDAVASIPSPAELTWRQLPDEAPEWIAIDGPAEPVYMGTAGGYHVCGIMTIPLQEKVRNRLGTSGGDDRLQLLARQLDRSQSVMAYLKTIRLLVQHGDAALPVLRKEIQRLDGSQRHGVIISLMRIPGPESAGILRGLYEQDDMRVEMNYLMRIGPYRPDLEEIYTEIRADTEKH